MCVYTHSGRLPGVNYNDSEGRRMKIKIRGTGEGAVLDIIQPGADGAEDTVLNSVAVLAGKELDVTLPGVTDVTDHSQIEYGEPVDTSAPEPAEPPAGGEGEAPAEEPAPPAEEPKDTSEIPEGCAPGRIVTFRSPESGVDLSAVIGGTIASVPQAVIDSGDVPELTSPKRVHLTVISPFLGEDSKGGTFQAFNVPQAPAEVPEGEEIPKGTWRWPERV